MRIVFNNYDEEPRSRRVARRLAGDVPYYVQEGNAMKTKTNIKAGTTAVSKPGASLDPRLQVRGAIAITNSQPSSVLGPHHLIQLVEHRIRFPASAALSCSVGGRLKTAYHPSAQAFTQM